MCLGCVGVRLLLGPGMAGGLLFALYLASYLGLAWGTITLFRGADNDAARILSGLKRCLVWAAAWLLVAGWIIARWLFSGLGGPDYWVLLAAAPPVAIIAMDGFLLTGLRPALARAAADAAADATLDSA